MYNRKDWWVDLKIILKIQLQKKVSQHIPSCFAMSAISSFRCTENKHNVCRGKDCMKKFCESSEGMQ